MSSFVYDQALIPEDADFQALMSPGPALSEHRPIMVRRFRWLHGSANRAVSSRQSNWHVKWPDVSSSDEDGLPRLREVIARHDRAQGLGQNFLFDFNLTCASGALQHL
jgi:hypothetical protein